MSLTLRAKVISQTLKQTTCFFFLPSLRRYYSNDPHNPQVTWPFHGHDFLRTLLRAPRLNTRRRMTFYFSNHKAKTSSTLQPMTSRESQPSPAAPAKNPLSPSPQFGSREILHPHLSTIPQSRRLRIEPHPISPVLPHNHFV